LDNVDTAALKSLLNGKHMVFAALPVSINRNIFKINIDTFFVILFFFILLKSLLTVLTRNESGYIVKIDGSMPKMMDGFAQLYNLT